MATVEWDTGYTKTLTIANGQTVSTDTLSLTRKGRRGRYMVTVFAPATLAETVTVRVAPSAGATFRILQSAGADLAVGAGDAITFDLVAGALRLVAGSAVGADRTFELMASVEF